MFTAHQCEKLDPYLTPEERRELDQLSAPDDSFEKYQTDPNGYAEDILKVRWWEKQQEVARALVKFSKVFVKASHNVGKTFQAGGLVNWHYDCFKDSITKTTAPTNNQVINLTWKEVRLQRKGPGMLPKAPKIETYFENGEINPGHFAAGYTARDADSFQGDHAEHLLIIFEEAVGIKEEFWNAAEGMLSSGGNNRWLCIMNPTDTSSYAYQAEMSGEWHVVTISALTHPNVRAELLGLPRPFPKAISLDWVQKKIKSWCQPLTSGDTIKATDFCWPPADIAAITGAQPKWFRPGPLFESRVMGRWPSQAINAVWSEALWDQAVLFKPELIQFANQAPVEIGCDVAREGDDYTSMHVRRGPVSLWHETHQGWKTNQTAGRLKELAREFGFKAGQNPRTILIKIDDDGVGGGVVDQAEGYNFVGLNAQTPALDPEHYPNRRSEVWFVVADRADRRMLDLSRLSPEHQMSIRLQFMGPTFTLNGAGQRVVEAKPETKKRLKRSPDDADAVNLAYATATPGAAIAGASGLITSASYQAPINSILDRLGA